MPECLVLTGPTGSGKTTLALALARALPTWLYFEADKTYPRLIPARNKPRSVSLTYHKALNVWLREGYSIISDGALLYEDFDARRKSLSLLSEHGNVRVVAVTASGAELHHRLQESPEQAARSAQQLSDIATDLPIALTVDTTAKNPKQLAAEVVARLGLPPQ